ncbi:sensor histidine kinase [Chryseobacterium tongliaoense]|uniref:sensor histidine kinase n=1 Tax=Chryseobacterium tongliaoense TaxID=3240933 RepID=UPI0035138DFB
MKLYYIIFILSSMFLHAQRYTSRWYSMDEGLPQNSIKDIIKDKYGFIWLSTDGGILRYDGAGFSLHNNFKISNSSFGNFLGTENGDIICFNNNDENCVLISDRTVKMLPYGKVSRTVSITNNKQYKRYYKSSFLSRFFPETNCYYIKTSSETYFFDNHHVIYKNANGSEKKILSDFPSKSLMYAFEQKNIIYIPDPRNRRTIILKNGTVSYDNKPSLYNDPESKIYWHQGTKQVFVINDGDIYISKINAGKPALTFLMQYKKIEKELLYCMFYDEESDKFYFGNVVKGLNIVNLSQFYIPQKNIPFSGEVVYEALPFTSNSIISKQGFEYSKDKVSKIYSADFNYDKRYLLYDNSNNLLYVEFNKLHRRYRASHYQKHDSISFPNRNVEGLFKINNRIVINMADRKYEYYNLYWFTSDAFREARNIFRCKDNINFIKEYNHDLIYIGTSNGIYLLSLSRNKILKHLAKDLPIKEIQRTKDGNYWFTTHNKGFYLLKNDKIIRMPDDKDGYISGAHHILEDRNGVFWISSNNGLFKVPEKMLLNYARNKNAKVIYYRYTKEDGFLNNEFNGSSNPSGTILENGEFVFPSMEGFVFFKPDGIKTHYPEGNQLHIEKARIGKKMIYFKDNLKLESDYKTAEIFIDIPYFHNIENIYIESLLENSSNNKWEEVKKDRKYILSNIAPGKYNLIIRFLTSENGKFAYKKIRIEIKPFFYQTMWFKILIGLSGIILVVIIVQIRTNFIRIINKKLKHNLYSRNQELKETTDTLEMTRNKLKNESEYQQKIMESISHDITTPVKFIALLSQKLSEADDPLAQKKYFDGIYKTSEQLFKFTLGLKEYTELYKEENTSEEKEYSLFEVIEDKKLLFEEMASENNTTIANLCDPGLKIKTNKNILSTILHNLIDNAVKNTTKGEISIEATTKNEMLEITISDTGKGMSQTQIAYYSQVFERMESENFVYKNYGLGLHMVIQLSKKLNAKISFHENTLKGTVVKIILKVD